MNAYISYYNYPPTLRINRSVELRLENVEGKDTDRKPYQTKPNRKNNNQTHMQQKNLTFSRN